MANEHLKTAASNIQRAVVDVRTLQKQLKTELENIKRENEKTINRIKDEIAALEQRKRNSLERAADKFAEGMRQQMLQAEISRIHADTEKLARDREREISALDGQINEFESLSTHLLHLA